MDLDNTEFSTEETATFFETEADIAAGIVVVYDALGKGPYDYNTTNSVQGSVYDLSTILMGSGVHTIWDTRSFGTNTFTS
ncbi:hypothetical protein [uncultured Polaribacter sp.]|uniref:hypothetical protein n=1 Tax=uncultured Polaribacter sp. TaxID=174711 RepID=UPI00262B51DD|nr:hypothetical protein [uncultured Polaribacter sp.]